MSKQTVVASRVTALFRACSDPTRLRILHLLRAGETCVGDIVSMLGVPQPSASRHLAYLRKVGLVTTRKHEQWVHYALSSPRDEVQSKLLELLAVVGDRPEARADARRAARLRETGGCCPGRREIENGPPSPPGPTQ